MPVQTRARARAENTANPVVKGATQSEGVSPSKAHPAVITRSRSKGKHQAKAHRRNGAAPTNKTGLEDDIKTISQLMTLPLEVRLSIYKLLLPCDESLVLDPENLDTTGLPYRRHYESTASLARVSKQVYIEVIPLIYSRNVLTILGPSYFGQLDTVLSEFALKHVKRVECGIIKSLAELGHVWEDFAKFGPIVNLRLT